MYVVFVFTPYLQAAVFREDFETERRDRVDAHDRFEIERADYKLQISKLQDWIAQQETHHAKQIQHYRTELEIIKAAMARQADNHANIQQLMEEKLKMVSHQLNEEKEKNMVGAIENCYGIYKFWLELKYTSVAITVCQHEIYLSYVAQPHLSYVA